VVAGRANTGQVALLGLGRMGRAFAIRLAREDLSLKAWTRSQPPRETVPGLEITNDIGDAVRDADIVITILTDAAAVSSVLFSSHFIASVQPNTIVIDMGTSGPLAAREHCRLLARHGIDYLDAPVSGGVGAAASAQLTIFVGGDVAVFNRARPLLERLGKPRLLGPVGAGQTAKLANQIIVAVNIAAVAEALRFAERFGLQASELVEALEGGFADSTVLRQHGARMVRRNFEAGGACRLHLKDLRLIEELLEGDVGLLRHTSASLEGFEKLVATGFSEADHSSYFQLYENALRRDTAQ
jgi:2-hydroxy-3-oxopropionate reductase